MRIEKGQKVNWAHIIFNSLCSELDRWYKYVKDNKGDKKYTCQFALVLEKIFWYLFVHHQPRFKELGRRFRQHWKTKRKLQQILQEVLLKRIIELRKENFKFRSK
jgi:hypothetical protein